MGAIWGAKVHATQLVNVGESQVFFSATPMPAINTIVLCQIKCVFQSGAIASLRVNFYSTLDDSSEVWDSDIFYLVDVVPVTPISTILISNRYKFRVGVSLPIDCGEIATSVDFWYRTGVEV